MNNLNLTTTMRIAALLGVLTAITANSIQGCYPQPELQQDFRGKLNFGEDSILNGEAVGTLDLLIVDEYAEATFTLEEGVICFRQVCRSAGDLVFSGPVTVYSDGFRANLNHDVYEITAVVDAQYGVDRVVVTAVGYGATDQADFWAGVPTHSYFVGRM